MRSNKFYVLVVSISFLFATADQANAQSRGNPLGYLLEALVEGPRAPSGAQALAPSQEPAWQPNASELQHRCASDSHGNAYLNEFFVQAENGTIRERGIRAYQSNSSQRPGETCNFNRNLPMDACFIAAEEAPLIHCRRDLERITRAILRIRNRETMDDDFAEAESGRRVHFYCAQVRYKNCFVRSGNTYCAGPEFSNSVGYFNFFLIKETYDSNGLRLMQRIYSQEVINSDRVDAHSLVRFPATSEGGAQCEALKRSALASMRARALQTGGAPERSVRTR